LRELRGNHAYFEHYYFRFGIQQIRPEKGETFLFRPAGFNKQRDHDSIELAEKYKLSGMSMRDISTEVKVVRKNAKSHS
jgi:hypothetical protein